MKTRILFSVSVFTVLLVTGLAGFAQRPTIGGYTVYYGSLHNHSNVSSDALGTPTQAYNYARDNAKLDFFGLSDHAQDITSSEWDIVKSAANSANSDGNFTAFYGFEWTSFFSYGHVTVVGTDEYCSTSSPTNNFTGLLAWINARNGIAFFNHPGWDIFASNEFNKFTNTPSDKFVGMELWNDKDGFSKYFYNNGFYSTDGGKNYFDEALSRGWKIGAAGGDDNHKATWGNATPWRVGVLANSLTRSDILEAFRARRIFSTLDKNLSLSFTINGAQMGSTVSTSSLNLVIDAQDADAGESFNKVVIMKNGAVLETINLTQWANPMQLTRTLTGVNNDYFYVKVTQTDGDEAVSSPIFISGPVNQPPIVSITSPANSAIFGFGIPIIIDAAASDPDVSGSVTKVEFYQGSTKLGEDAASPYSFAWTPTVAGNYSLTAKATDNTGAVTTSATINISVTQPATTLITSAILTGNDDAEETSKGVVNLISDDIDLVYDSKTTGNQTVGLRFQNIAIPKGAIITTASVQFNVKTATSGSSSISISGQSTDNAGVFSTVTKNLSSRTKTIAVVNWSPAAWTAVDKTQTTPDLKSIVQEVVNRTGWVSGNALAIFFKGSGTRIADSYESPAAVPAKLLVEYYTTKSATIENWEELLSDEITIYPNPVTDRLILKVNGETSVERILIYSITGSLIKEITNIQKQPETTISCGSFTPGIYVMRVQTSKGLHSFRFVKQ